MKLNISNPRTLLKNKNIQIAIVLFLIFLSAYYIRAQSARFNEIPDIDTWYFYRLSETFLETKQWISFDYMRNYPFGIQAELWDGFMPIYFPPVVYMLGGGWGMSFFDFALFFPAFFGSLSVILMFFVVKEFFDKRTGLFASFFLATLPAYITRTAAGEYEKEAVASVFILLFILFFIKAYKKSSWKYSVLSGISFLLLAQSWGGSRYFSILVSIFVIILALFEKDAKKPLKAYLPMFIVGTLPQMLLPFNPYVFTSSGFLVMLVVSIILLTKYASEKFNFVKEKNMKYVVPCTIATILVLFLLGSMFFEQFYGILDEIIAYSTQRLATEGITVAENRPGDLAYIQSQTDLRYNTILPELNWLFVIASPLVLASIGFLIILYFIIRYLILPAILGLIRNQKTIYKQEYMLLLLPFLWFTSAILATLSLVRLSFILGPAFAFLAAVTVIFAIDLIKKKKLLLGPEPIIVIISILVILNIANAASYGHQITPSICIPNPQILIDGQKCLETDNEGNIVKFAEGQPWYSALNFLKDQTPKNSVVTSWWDFGYWFQYRGDRPTITDGGMGLRYETAVWFTDDYKNWEESFAWMKERNVSHILMDWSLIGKYGAISLISSKGKQADQFLQFSNNINSPTKTYDKGNGTIILEYRVGTNTIWMPINNGSFSDAPLLFQQQGNQGVGGVFIDEVCTTNGILKFEITTKDFGGCVSVSQYGVYYIPEHLKNNIFVRLMFMEGSGLPVTKVFDNGVIQIYEVVGIL